MMTGHFLRKLERPSTSVDLPDRHCSPPSSAGLDEGTIWECDQCGDQYELFCEWEDANPQWYLNTSLQAAANRTKYPWSARLK